MYSNLVHGYIFTVAKKWYTRTVRRHDKKHVQQISNIKYNERIIVVRKIFELTFLIFFSFSMTRKTSWKDKRLHKDGHKKIINTRTFNIVTIRENLSMIWYTHYPLTEYNYSVIPPTPISFIHISSSCFSSSQPAILICAYKTREITDRR